MLKGPVDASTVPLVNIVKQEKERANHATWEHIALAHLVALVVPSILEVLALQHKVLEANYHALLVHIAQLVWQHVCHAPLDTIAHLLLKYLVQKVHFLLVGQLDAPIALLAQQLQA